MTERCATCGWTGTEAQKERSGLSDMKGPGICPDCGGDEFD